MGAGSCEEHYMQDAGEIYWTYIVQKELESRGLNISSVESREVEFNKYCLERDICSRFSKSDYKKNLDLCYEKFVDELTKKYPGKIDITNVEAEYRNKSLKGDFILTLENEEIISVSLKNYRCGYDSIQLASGTWHSFINSCVLKETCGPGMYIDSETGKPFKAQKKSLAQRDKNYVLMGHEDILEDMKLIDIILQEVKDKYVTSDETRFFTDEVKAKWAKDCSEYGLRGIDIVINALDKLKKDNIKKNLMKKADLYHEEELLLIGKGGNMTCSLFNEKYKSLLERVNSEECELTYIKHNKNLRIIFTDSAGEILHIDIPFTLQKNGAWHLPKESYEGEVFHAKEKVSLSYGERRPKKSKEISTSTNMWFKIKEYL